MLLTAVETQAERRITVDGIVGSADLFANEVVAGWAAIPPPGCGLSERMAAQGMKVDAVLMDDFRRTNAADTRAQACAQAAGGASSGRRRHGPAAAARRGAGRASRPRAR